MKKGGRSVENSVSHHKLYYFTTDKLHEVETLGSFGDDLPHLGPDVQPKDKTDVQVPVVEDEDEDGQYYEDEEEDGRNYKDEDENGKNYEDGEEDEDEVYEDKNEDCTLVPSP